MAGFANPNIAALMQAMQAQRGGAPLPSITPDGTPAGGSTFSAMPGGGAYVPPPGAYVPPPGSGVTFPTGGGGSFTVDRGQTTINPPGGGAPGSAFGAAPMGMGGLPPGANLNQALQARQAATGMGIPQGWQGALGNVGAQRAMAGTMGAMPGGALPSLNAFGPMGAAGPMGGPGGGSPWAAPNWGAIRGFGAPGGALSPAAIQRGRGILAGRMTPGLAGYQS